MKNILIKSNRSLIPRFTPAKMIFGGFITFILTGAILLCLPISSVNRQFTPFIDALFTSTSSVCITGLAIADTNTHWSLFGKIIILVLIQTGALGIMSVVTLFSAITGRDLGLSQRLALKESISNFTLTNVVTMFKGIFKATILFEAIGAFLFSFALIPKYGWLGGIGKSIFQSVSAFCNAGFDVFGTESSQFLSLSGFDKDGLVLIVSSLLTIIGGLGFIVWDDLYRTRRFSRYTLHTKIVLLMTAILITVGTLVFFALEAENSLPEASLPVRLLNSFFFSVSTRTAGFATFDVGKMHPASSIVTIILMFIGAAPGSTAGGIKVTTFFILMITVITYLRGKKEVQAFKRRITSDVINKSVAIFILSLFLILSTSMVLLYHDKINLEQALFEATSALATVGLSTGITPQLSGASKLQLILTMFLGRVGIITTFTAITGNSGKNNIRYRYPEGKITVG